MKVSAKVVLFLGWFVLIAAAASATEAITDIASDDSWVLMGDRSFIPYEYNENGQIKGANVDLIREIEKTTGKKITIELNPWADSQEKVKKGEANGLTMTTMSEERSKIYDYTRPTFYMKFSLFVQLQNIDLLTIDKLAGKKIAVKKGGYPAQLMTKNHPEVTAVVVENVLEGFRLLMRNDVDGVLEEEWVGYYTLKENKFSGIRAVAQPIASRPCYIGLRKGNPKAITLLNRAIEMIIADGRYDRIMSKWSGQQIILVKKESFNRYSLILAIVLLTLVASIVLATIARLRIKRKAVVLESLATVDHLTNIGNRKLFNRSLELEWKRMEREKKPLGLILFVVDAFGMLNESHGKKAGNKCLRQVADTLSANTFRPGDMIARYDNEEFAVILPDTDSKGALKVAETLRRAVQKLEVTHVGSSQAYTITASVGVASVHPIEIIKPEDLVELAHDALLKAIENGQNRVCAA